MRNSLQMRRALRCCSRNRRCGTPQPQQVPNGLNERSWMLLNRKYLSVYGLSGDSRIALGSGSDLLGARGESGVLNHEFWENAACVETWAELHRTAVGTNEPASAAYVHLRRSAVRDDEFVAATETRFERQWPRTAANIAAESGTRKFERVTSGCPGEPP